MAIGCSMRPAGRGLSMLGARLAGPALPAETVNYFDISFESCLAALLTVAMIVATSADDTVTTATLLNVDVTVAVPPTAVIVVVISLKNTEKEVATTVDMTLRCQEHSSKRSIRYESNSRFECTLPIATCRAIGTACCSAAHSAARGVATQSSTTASMAASCRAAR